MVAGIQVARRLGYHVAEVQLCRRISVWEQGEKHPQVEMGEIGFTRMPMPLFSPRVILITRREAWDVAQW